MVLPAALHRVPGQGRRETDQQAEEGSDDDRVPPAARGRFHACGTREQLRPLDLLGLDEQLVRLQLVLEYLSQLHAEHGLRGRVRGTRGLLANRADLYLISFDAVLQALDLSVCERRETIDDDGRQRVGGNLRAPPG